MRFYVIKFIQIDNSDIIFKNGFGRTILPRILLGQASRGFVSLRTAHHYATPPHAVEIWHRNQNVLVRHMSFGSYRQHQQHNPGISSDSCHFILRTTRKNERG